MTHILLFDADASKAPKAFSASQLNLDAVGNEKLIQRLIFENPDLIPIEDIDPGSGCVAPFCRELTLRGAGGPVYLDMIGVTRRGRLVLIECKLWRNPQARREVIGQILEYAALVRRLSYSDLSAMVGQKSGRSGPNILWDLARERLGLEDEAAFVDSVTESLESGVFDLIILGDGIRGEVEVVRSYLEAAGLRSRLTLVEVNCWKDAEGRTLFVPKIALRTRVIAHRVTTSISGADLASEAPAPRREENDAARANRMDNRTFWQSFIDQVTFSHPDQPPSTHGGNNWVRLPLPLYPAVAYRAVGANGSNSALGIYLRFAGEGAGVNYQAIADQLPDIEAELQVPLRANWVSARDAWDISLDAPPEASLDDKSQMAWLLKMADRFVSVLRPRLAQLATEPSAEH